MKAIEHTIDIDAPPDIVWNVLADVDRYDEWNPFLTMDRFPAAAGDRLRVTVRPGRREMTFRPTVTVFDQGRHLAWLGRFLAPRVVDGEHTLTLEPLPDGRTRFCQREVFRGILVPLMGSMLRRTEAGFAAMNAALADRVAARAAAGWI